MGQNKDQGQYPQSEWNKFFLWLIVAFAVYLTARRIFLSGIPCPGDVMPGSNKEMFCFLFGDIAQFITVFITVFIITIVFNKLKKYSVKDSIPKLLLVALIWTIALSAILTFGEWSAARRAENKTTEVAAYDQSEIKPVTVLTTYQNSGGLTEENFDQDKLIRLQTWIVETMIQKARAEFVEKGYNSKEFKPNVSANSVFVNATGKNLAVIRININNSARLVTVIGIKGSEMYRVSCMRASNHDIPVWSGECGAEVHKIFGVSIKP